MEPEEDPVEVLMENVTLGLKAAEAVGIAMVRRMEDAGLEMLDNLRERLLGKGAVK
jgi:hypothetical protein